MHIKTLKDRPNATPRQKVMSEIMPGANLHRKLQEVLARLKTL